MDTDKLLLEQYTAHHPEEAVHNMEKLTAGQIAAILAELPCELSLSILSKMNSYIAAKSLEQLDTALASDLIEKMDLSLADSLLRRCESQFCDSIVNTLSPRLASLITQKLNAKQDTVASFMDPTIFVLKKHRTVEEAIRLIKQVKKGISNFVCIVDDHENYQGVVMLRDILFAENHVRMSSLIKAESPSFNIDTILESLTNNPIWHQFRAVPIIDFNDKLVGILDYKSVFKNTPDPRSSLTRQLIETSNSLGELYGLGLSGFLNILSK